MNATSALVAFVFLALCVPARAADAPADAGPGADASARGDCICRAQGRAYMIGQTVCLRTPKGDRLATCGMVLNNTSWLFSADPCTISQHPPGLVRRPPA